ncbi:class I SAM-dependent methyltransferase [Nocardiopsis gilva YIM 90087]|uniref:Class I SAM-dependent methyltransferase n=1 Tax=Nocardiopsis gilva YIM 90087 TaxID=1235441 RepID=A0A223S6Y2_9ACTN|nr:methyltransferase domain-containing protein [Nocardiopsis gilva]ASU83888.1 class I SAM-dependent methyltransferase [Nocardiopsis gilva YIM 90087]
MTADQESGTSDGPTIPTPEEIGASYDQYGDFYGMVLGDSAIHSGMWITPGERAAPVDVIDLADRAQDRQTDYLIDTLRPLAGEHMLDVGCGTGGPAIRAAQRSGARVTGVTVSTSQVAEAEERIRAADLGGQVEVVYGNAMDLDYGDETFACAWAIEAIHHLSDRLAGLREVGRVLVKGGHFLLTEFVLRGTPTEGDLAVYTGFAEGPPPRPLPVLLGEVDQAGFDIVQVVDMSSSYKLSADVMALLYRDRRDEIEARFGAETVMWMDTRLPIFRSVTRNHIDYVTVLLRKRG